MGAGYRGLPGQHPKKVSKLSRALALGAATLVLGAGVAAQEAAGLRQHPDPAPLGMRGSTGAQPEQAAEAAQARTAAQRAAARRYRQATTRPVQAWVRAATRPPATFRGVLPIFGADAGPPLRLRKRVKEVDPYAQVGYRVGGVALFPAIEQGIGYDSNPNRTSGPKKGSLLLRSEGELRVQSEWLRHELTGVLRGARIST